jgi:hypothetical protein
MPMAHQEVRNIVQLGLPGAGGGSRATGPKGPSFTGIWFAGPAARDRRFHLGERLRDGAEIFMNNPGKPPAP